MRDVESAGGRPELARLIGVRALALTGFSLTVGSGIFGLPAPAAALLGHQAIVGYLACGAVFALLGLCLAEAGSRVGRSGGLYAYADEAFGPFVGWIAGTLLWFANCVLSSAAVANLLVDTLGTVAPVLRAGVTRALFLVLLYGVLATINMRGAPMGVRLSELVAVLKAAPLIALAVGGAFFIDPANLRWTAVPQSREVAEASTLLFFAFMGIEGALCTSGEVRDPQRTIPRAILLSIAFVSILYVAIHLVVQGILGDALPGTAAPLVSAASAAFGPIGGSLLVLATVISAAGFFASDMLSSPRTLYALAHDGQLPAPLARVHPRFATPSNAILAYAAIAALLATSGTFRQLAILSSAGTLLLYLICCLGVLRLRARGEPQPGTFRVPGGPVVPLLASAGVVWMLSSLRGIELAATVALVSIAAAAYLLRARRPRVA